MDGRKTRLLGTMMARLSETIMLISALILPAATLADSIANQEFIAARFGNHSNSILTNLQCPKQKDDRNLIGVYCQATIDVDGQVRREETFCFGDTEKDHGYAVRAEKAVKKSLFLPASVDGEKVKVLFSFRIFFSYSGDDCSVSAIPNLGFQYEELENTYSAPQEIRTDSDWQKKSHNLGHQVNESVAVGLGGIMFAMSVAVSRTGEASDAKLEKSNFAEAREIRAALSAISKSQFIPGFYEGQPHAMRYYEFLYVR